jgi:hypothetical protein
MGGAVTRLVAGADAVEGGSPKVLGGAASVVEVDSPPVQAMARTSAITRRTPLEPMTPFPSCLNVSANP